MLTSVSYALSPTVLEKYELHEFVPLVDAIRKGDLRTFNDTLVSFQDRFIRYVSENGSLPC